MNLFITYSDAEIETLKKAVKYKNVSLVNNSLQEKLLEISSHIKIFRNISKEILPQIIYEIEIKKYHKDEVIIKENEIDTKIYFILNGSVDVTKNNQKISELHQFDTFGEIGAMLNKKRTASIIAKEDSAILNFTINFDLLEESNKFSYYFVILYKNLSLILTEKLIQTNEKLIS